MTTLTNLGVGCQHQGWFVVRGSRFAVRGSWLVIRQSERDQLSAVAGTTHRKNDVLTTVQHVGHRRAALWCGHVDGADFLAARLVVGAQHCAACTRRRRSESGFTRD